MEKKDIIKKFLEFGYQLDNESLDFFNKNPNKINIFLNEIKNKKIEDKVIKFDFIKSFPFQKNKIEIFKQLKEKEKSYIVEDYVQFFNSRYEKIKKILSTRFELINLLSINKISEKTTTFSIIGMVKEKNENEKYILIEDNTGELIVYFDENSFKKYKDIVEDEIIGLLCKKENNIIKIKNIIFPDISLKREINKIKDDVFCFFISDLHMDNKIFNKKAYENFLQWIKEFKNKLYIFIIGDVSSKKEDILDFFSCLPSNIFKVYQKGEIDPNFDIGDLNITNPSMLKVEDNITIFLYHGNILTEYLKIWNTQPEILLLNLLKKRNMNPIFKFNKKIYEEDVFLLDTVPDIIVTGHLHTPGMVNYKGTTIISNGSFITQPIFWMVNLKTRETIKMDFT
ncbi:MAG: hypothetical protein NC899_07770 [Candidatus Omnitrophica bacterium]|nr:hypothetical protein [Candidatus Omnitrophota bacterium]